NESERVTVAPEGQDVVAALAELVASAVPVGPGGAAPDAADRGQAPPKGEQPPTDPGDESGTAWELFYLDLNRRLRQFGRPGAARPEPKLPGGLPWVGL